MEHRLYRDKARAVAGGVAAGIGNYLRIDTTLVRAIFIFLVLFGRTGVFSSFIVYLILWIAIPALPLGMRQGDAFEAEYRVDPVTGARIANPVPSVQTGSSKIFGFILLGLGIVFLADRFIDIDWNFDRYWPALLIIAGIALLINKNKHSESKPLSDQPGPGYKPTAAGPSQTDPAKEQSDL